jgi:hypothetical protein
MISFLSFILRIIREKDIKMLEAVDEYLLRSLVHAHAKTPLEFL